MADENKDGIEDSVDQVSYNAVKDRIKAFDFERIMALMGVIEKIVAVSPRNTSISGIAQAELEAFNVEAKEIALARKEAADKEIAKRDADAQNERDEEVERQDDEAERNDSNANRALRQRQAGGTPDDAERPDPTPGQPRPDLQRQQRRPEAPDTATAPGAPVNPSARRV